MEFTPPPPVPRPTQNDYGKGFLSGALTEPARAGAGGPTISFQLYDASDGDGLKVGVRAGFVDATGQGFADFPTSMSAGDDPPFSLSVSGDGVVYLHVTITAPTDTDDASVDSVAVENAASKPDNTSTEGYCYLGSYSDNGDGTLAVVGAAGDKGYLYCNGHYFWAM